VLNRDGTFDKIMIAADDRLAVIARNKAKV
jgi:hypothetical protein